MKTFVLTAEAEYEGGGPVLVILARSRGSALKKIGATKAPCRPGFSNHMVTLSEESRSKFGVPKADGYLLYESKLL